MIKSIMVLAMALLTLSSSPPDNTPDYVLALVEE